MFKKMLPKLHEVGVQICEHRAQNVHYWPSICSNIKQMVNNCKTCAMHKPSNSKKAILFHDILHLPWSKLSPDIFST